jgi:hypothetical protein
MSNCRGRGTEIDPTEQEVNQGVNEILEASLQDAVKHGERSALFAGTRRRSQFPTANRCNLACC